MGGADREGGVGVFVRGVTLTVNWEVTSDVLEFIITTRMNHRNSSAVQRTFWTSYQRFIYRALLGQTRKERWQLG